MERTDHTEHRVRTREAALRLLNRLTLGAGVAGAVAVAVLGGVSAATIPGSASTAPATPTGGSAQATTPAAPSSTSSSANPSSSSLRPSTGVGTSSGMGHAVTGASH